MNIALKSICAVTLAAGALAGFAPTQMSTAAAALHAAATAQDQDLTVRVVYPANQSGQVWVAVFDDQAGFDSRASIQDVAIPANQQPLETTLSGLPDGEYAIIAFHDDNANGEFDTNFMGIPAEKYGFSNNPHPRFRAATWQESRFVLEGDRSAGLTIELMGAG